jgi:hypothetical protein
MAHNIKVHYEISINEITKVCPEDKTHHWVSFVRFETFVNPFAKDCG